MVRDSESVEMKPLIGLDLLISYIHVMSFKSRIGSFLFYLQLSINYELIDHIF